MRILLISDIHGNFPALRAVFQHFAQPFDLILNGGDTTVYGPFPNQTIDWLRSQRALSILGNTDRHLKTLLGGNTFKKPRKPDKRIMYGWSAAELSSENRQWLLEQPYSRTIELSDHAAYRSIGMYHGSPDNPDEFLFADTADSRFCELALETAHEIITIGHSHSPFHKEINGIHFINPGSVGRMFDTNPSASCGVLVIENDNIEVSLHRISYQVEDVIEELARLRFPPVYQEMYRTGRKLN